MSLRQEYSSATLPWVSIFACFNVGYGQLKLDKEYINVSSIGIYLFENYLIWLLI